MVANNAPAFFYFISVEGWSSKHMAIVFKKITTYFLYLLFKHAHFITQVRISQQKIFTLLIHCKIDRVQRCLTNLLFCFGVYYLIFDKGSLHKLICEVKKNYSFNTEFEFRITFLSLKKKKEISLFNFYNLSKYF